MKLEIKTFSVHSGQGILSNKNTFLLLRLILSLMQNQTKSSNKFLKFDNIVYHSLAKYKFFFNPFSSKEHVLRIAEFGLVETLFEFIC